MPQFPILESQPYRHIFLTSDKYNHGIHNLEPLFFDLQILQDVLDDIVPDQLTV